MKNYEEMAHNVFKRINEYEAEKKRKKSIAVKTMAAVCPAVIITVAGVGIWKSGAMIPPENNFTNNIVVELTTDSPTENITESVVTYAKTTTAKNDIITDKTFEDTTSAVYADDKVIPEIDSYSEVDETIDDNSISYEIAPSVDNSISTVTDTPIIQPETEYIPADPVTPPATEEDGSGSMGDMLGFVYVNNELFMQNFDDKIYTFGEYIGSGTEFEGSYKNDSQTFFYYATEDKNVILVKLSNGGQVTLVKTELPNGERVECSEPNEWTFY